MEKHTICVLKGDQTGQELLDEALRVLDPSVIRMNNLAFEAFDLSLENRRQTQNGVVHEAARRVLTGQMRRQGRVWICVFPDKPVSSKPIETRMGGGKGATDRWVAPIKPGRVLFEISGVESDVAVRALQLAANKLPVASRILSRTEEFVVG